jgi:hypothetical protein
MLWCWTLQIDNLTMLKVCAFLAVRGVSLLAACMSEARGKQGQPDQYCQVQPDIRQGLKKNRIRILSVLNPDNSRQFCAAVPCCAETLVMQLLRWTRKRHPAAGCGGTMIFSLLKMSVEGKRSHGRY